MTRARLAALGRSLGKDDEVVIEATGNAMAVVRVLSPYVGRVIVANPLQVKAIAHAHVKTDKIDAGVLASLRAADFLPEIWLPDADTERRRRLVARRNQMVRQGARLKAARPGLHPRSRLFAARSPVPFEHSRSRRRGLSISSVDFMCL